MAESRSAIHLRKFGATFRRDAWWVEILPVIIVLGGFGVYATIRAFEGAYYEWGPYISPFYSPLIDPEHRWWPFSPAVLILGIPLGFRTTCYYYRKAYYRSFFLRPPACAVTARNPGRYTGERTFPLVLQNLHRYFLYLSVIFIGFLWYDAGRAIFFADGPGIGVGTLVMLTNVILLTLYTFSCHSLRHLVGGNVDCFSCEVAGATRYKAWRGVSILNARHNLWAWLSLFSVGLTDLYVMLLARGVITDWRIL